MSSLKFTSEDLEFEGIMGDVDYKTFHLLRDFLQPTTALTLKSTARSILDILPADKDPYSNEVYAFSTTCIEFGEQIPYHHPSQLKLVALLEHISYSTKLGKITSRPTELNTREYYRYQYFKEAVVDGDSRPDPDRPGHYVNFHAFKAHLDERRIFGTDPTWAIWAQRYAHEEKLPEEPGLVRDEYMLAAAQYILWYGQSFFKQVIYSREVSIDTLQGWTPGPLYRGPKFLSLHRWHFWRDGYNNVASGGKEEFGRECRVVAAKAAAIMDSLEENMTFENL